MRDNVRACTGVLNWASQEVSQLVSLPQCREILPEVLLSFLLQGLFGCLFAHDCA